MASGFSVAPGILLATDTTARATVPRTSVAAVESVDGFGDGLRSRRLRDAVERAATFFFAMRVVFFFAVRFFATVFRVFFRVVFLATLTPARDSTTIGVEHVITSNASRRRVHKLKAHNDSDGFGLHVFAPRR